MSSSPTWGSEPAIIGALASASYSEHLTEMAQHGAETLPYKFGYDPVHFGVIMIFNLAMGTITPPVGTGLFVGASVARVKVEAAVRALAPFYLLLLALLLLITYLPWLTMWLPRRFGL